MSKKTSTASTKAAKAAKAVAEPTPPPVPPDNPLPPTGSDPALQSAAGREWLGKALKNADRQLIHGPGEQGWVHNESLRPAIEERVAFLRALIALLP